jgi:hypothetical protein
MALPGQSTIRNGLLSALSAADDALVQPGPEAVFLHKHDTLVEPNEAIAHVHFPETAIGSMVAIPPEGHRAEAAVLGCDGMSAVALVPDTDRTPHLVVVQVEGHSRRMTADAFRTLKAQSPTFNSLMLRFAQSVQVQTTYTALSSANHGVEERLARWLLMCHDRSAGDEIALTHEYLSVMLAVRRPSVTTALHVLEGEGFIRATRATIRVKDRAGIEDFAGAAYGIAEAEYERLIGPLH